jgi:hypothetical protein
VIQLIEMGKIICPPEAWEEVKRCPWVKAWLNEHRSRIVRSITDPGYLARVGQVTYRFPAMARARSSRDRADQYVVAMASYLNDIDNPRNHIVVARETPAKRKNRKIPTACQAFGVSFKTLTEVLHDEFPDEDWHD